MGLPFSLLMILTLMTMMTTQATDTDGTSHWTLEAYDCNSLKNLTSWSITDTCTKEEEPPDGEEKDFTLVQEQASVLAKGHKCTMIVSKFTMVCTNNLMASHQRIASVPQIEVPKEVTIEECRRMAAEHLIKGADGVDHEVLPGQERIFTFHAAGRNEVSGMTMICEGEDVKLGDHILKGVVVLEQMRVSLTEVNYRFHNTGGSEVKEDHMLLPCEHYLHYCKLSKATYIWGELDATKYRRVQHFFANLIQQDGEQVVVSQSQKIRIALGEEVKNQGKTYWLTKYPGILLTEGLADHLNEFKAENLKLTAWVAARDDFLSFAMERKILQAYRAMRHGQCRKLQDLVRTQFALASHNEDGITYINLRNDVFAFLLGEALYTFTCNKIQVIPRSGQKCSKELPVIANSKKIYLHPITRVLVPHSTWVPCSNLMPAKFLTEQGTWIAATPSLQVVPKPAQMEHGKGDDFSLRHTSMAKGGLYTEDQIKDFNRLISYSRLRTAIKNQVINDACQDNTHDMCLEMAATTDSSSKELNPVINFRNKLVQFFHNFGEIAASFIAIWIIMKATIFITSKIANCFFLQAVPWPRRVLQTMFGQQMINRDIGRQARRKKEISDKEEQERRDAATVADLMTEDEEERHGQGTM
jgi:hypothetical protein